jgi:hypothetical protein
VAILLVLQIILLISKGNVEMKGGETQ